MQTHACSQTYKIETTTFPMSQVFELVNNLYKFTKLNRLSKSKAAKIGKQINDRPTIHPHWQFYTQ